MKNIFFNIPPPNTQSFIVSSNFIPIAVDVFVCKFYQKNLKILSFSTSSTSSIEDSVMGCLAKPTVYQTYF